MNIYEIKNDLLSLFDEIEELGGEITPEIEEKLKITQESLKDKVKDYVNVIKLINSDIEAIKVEKKRLDDLAGRKQKVIDKLNNVLLETVRQFGDIKKSGVQFIDYGTGEVSIRKSTAVEVNDYEVERIINTLTNTFKWLKYENTLDVNDEIPIDEFIRNALNYEDTGIVVDEGDLENTRVEVSVKVPIKELLSSGGYNILKEICKYTPDYDVKPAIDKKLLKTRLTENGACAPNLAKLKTNENISIK